MKTSTSWNRRGSAVTANGFFTVLKSTGWFPTFRLPDGYRYLTGKSAIDPAHPIDVVSRLTISSRAAGDRARTDPTIALRQIDSGHMDARTVLRSILLALVAFAITCALLAWIEHPGKLF